VSNINDEAGSVTITEEASYGSGQTLFAQPLSNLGDEGVIGLYLWGGDSTASFYLDYKGARKLAKMLRQAAPKRVV
jgi:hypothetical protein